ncbi:MAG: hypothetical protein ACKVS9_09130 [Phycisphaerae bacterium]
MQPQMQQAVNDAVAMVNTQPGHTCVRLRFEGDPYEIDFVANAAAIAEGRFEFKAGFETYGGAVDELSDIRAELISH